MEKAGWEGGREGEKVCVFSGSQVGVWQRRHEKNRSHALE